VHSYCFRCGRDLTPGKTHCAKCGAIMWTGPRIPSFPRWMRGKPLAWRRARRVGRLPGEREAFRTKLPSASVYTVDRQSTLGSPIICTLTDRRLLVQGTLGSADIRLSRIRVAQARREWDDPTGFRYWVAIHRSGSECVDIRGDICLWCISPQQSEALAARIEAARASE
jgi:hypothetical protein